MNVNFENMEILKQDLVGNSLSNEEVQLESNEVEKRVSLLLRMRKALLKDPQLANKVGFSRRKIEFIANDLNVICTIFRLLNESDDSEFTSVGPIEYTKIVNWILSKDRTDACILYCLYILDLNYSETAQVLDDYTVEDLKRMHLIHMLLLLKELGIKIER